MNDSDTTQLTLVGHMIVTKWLKQNVQFHSFYTHSYYINGHKVSSNSNVVSIQTVRYFGRTAIYSMLYFNLFICLPNIFLPLTCNMNQIKSNQNQNQITFIVTSPQHKCLGEWNSYERAPDSAKNKIQNKTQQFTYGQYIYADCTEDNVQNTHTYTQYTQCTIKDILSYQYTNTHYTPYVHVCIMSTSMHSNNVKEQQIIIYSRLVVQQNGCATDSCARCNRLCICNVVGVLCMVSSDSR